MDTTNNDNVSEPQTPGGFSDTDFDDNLGVPDSLTVLDIQGSQIVLNTDDVEGPTPGRTPFSAVYQPPVKFKSFHRDIFISGSPIDVTIVDYEISHATHLLNPILYTISVQHGGFTWEIKKRYKHFQDLHHQLVMFRTTLNIPFPTKEHKRRRESFRNAPVSGKKKGVLPRFPKKPEVLISYEQIENRIKQL
ncbi:hypothetical protein AMK59_5301, partial [Oryctes borbonicus]